MTLRLFQGEDKTLSITTNADVSAATEIEFLIDTQAQAGKQISKTLTAGQITSVTATSFTVQIDAADSETVPEGNYKVQCRVTIADKKTNGLFQPNKIIIKDSVFVDEGTGNDYNGNLRSVC